MKLKLTNRSRAMLRLLLVPAWSLFTVAGSLLMGNTPSPNENAPAALGYFLGAILGTAVPIIIYGLYILVFEFGKDYLSWASEPLKEEEDRKLREVADLCTERSEWGLLCCLDKGHSGNHKALSARADTISEWGEDKPALPRNRVMK